MAPRRRRVSAHLVLDVDDPAKLVIQLAVSAMAPALITETLTVTVDGLRLSPAEVALPPSGRAQLIQATPGRMTIDYDAVIDGDAAPHLVSDADRIIYVRPSRYAESDRLAAVAQSEFAGITDAAELVAAVSSWVGSRLAYVVGSSGPTDGAVDTMLLRQGVCRDYVHLVVALLRGLDVPARLAAVYAPGLCPMDFHAVAEAAVGSTWRVVDATLLAPRSALVRIATGRDAADTAFLSTYGGGVELLESTVTATIDGQLPYDDVVQLISIS